MEREAPHRGRFFTLRSHFLLSISKYISIATTLLYFPFLPKSKFLLIIHPERSSLFGREAQLPSGPSFRTFLSVVHRALSPLYSSWIAVLIPESSFPFSNQLDAPTTLVETIVST